MGFGVDLLCQFVQKVVPVFVRWIDLGVVIHDLVCEREVVGEFSSCVTGVLAGVQGDVCVLGEYSQSRPFNFLPKSPYYLF